MRQTVILQYFPNAGVDLAEDLGSELSLALRCTDHWVRRQNVQRFPEASMHVLVSLLALGSGKELKEADEEFVIVLRDKTTLLIQRYLTLLVNFVSPEICGFGHCLGQH